MARRILKAERETPTHGFTLRGGNKWPDTPPQTEADGDPPLRFFRTTEQRLAKLQALEENGVAEWSGYDNAMEHLQNLTRELDNDVFINESEEAVYHTEWPSVPTEAKAQDPQVDLALDDLVQEECAEVIQAISKIRRFGNRNHITGYDNVAPLEDEIGQLYAALDAFIDYKLLDKDRIIAARICKENAIVHWAGFYERNRREV